jgi:hypothetical protein
MRRFWPLRVLKIAVLMALALVAFGFISMHLWNYVMPAVFGLHAITFWQAVALLVLGRLIFGGFGPHRGGMHWRQKMMERWEAMTPEEREKFRAGMRHRCGHRGEPASPAAPTAPANS